MTEQMPEKVRVAPDPVHAWQRFTAGEPGVFGTPATGAEYIRADLHEALLKRVGELEAIILQVIERIEFDYSEDAIEECEELLTAAIQEQANGGKDE